MQRKENASVFFIVGNGPIISADELILKNSSHIDNFYLLKLASLKEIVQTPVHVRLAPVRMVV